MRSMTLMLPLLLLFGCGSSSDSGTTVDASTTQTKFDTAVATNQDSAASNKDSGATQMCTTTTANEKGIGKPCTKGGMQCAATQTCTVEASPTPPPMPYYCSALCNANADCGTGATCCPLSSTIKVCAPNNCGCPQAP